MDITTIEDHDVQRFLRTFLKDRGINKEIYNRIPKEKLDYRMIHTDKRKSDSPRESIAHQVYVTRKYLYALKIGTLKFDGVVDKKLSNPQHMSKEELIRELESTDKELLNLLTTPGIKRKKIKVPWSQEPVPVLECLYALDSHEILHTGWNLALMDHLNIERFPLLKSVSG